ncbi:hypothetical protein RRG08_055287 [Elysia crispata]|uniref:Uncharacterized protein n=1 Tax=Elysia crispata TaxID=231223 RepID=A0AAE1E0Q8_9GAST|nr:hypothetical protein RRG08_055287 [Elysia crispata]
MSPSQGGVRPQDVRLLLPGSCAPDAGSRVMDRQHSCPASGFSLHCTLTAELVSERRAASRDKTVCILSLVVSWGRLFRRTWSGTVLLR